MKNYCDNYSLGWKWVINLVNFTYMFPTLFWKCIIQNNKNITILTNFLQKNTPSSLYTFELFLQKIDGMIMCFMRYTIIHHLETKRKTFESQSIQLDLIRFFSSAKLQITCCLLAKIYEKLPSLNILNLSEISYMVYLTNVTTITILKIIRPRPFLFLWIKYVK